MNETHASNHAWNILLIDAQWFIVDPTFGCGYWAYVPGIWTKLKTNILKQVGINTELEFIKQPDDNYFNLSLEKYKKCYFPIDVKWQLLNNPNSYSAFVKDTIIPMSRINYEEEIIKIRNRNLDDQLLQDAKNGYKYNPKNSFDFGQSYLLHANNNTHENYQVYDSLLYNQLQRNKKYNEKVISLMQESKVNYREYYLSNKKAWQDKFKKGLLAYRSFTKNMLLGIKKADRMRKKLITANKKLNNPKLILNELLDNKSDINDRKERKSTNLSADLEVWNNQVLVIDSLTYCLYRQLEFIKKDIHAESNTCDQLINNIEQVNTYKVFMQAKRLYDNQLTYNLHQKKFDALNEAFLSQLLIVAQQYENINQSKHKYLNYKELNELTTTEMTGLFPTVSFLRGTKQKLNSSIKRYNHVQTELQNAYIEFDALYGTASKIDKRFTLFYEFAKQRNDENYEKHTIACDAITLKAKMQLKYIKNVLQRTEVSLYQTQ